MLLFTQKQNTTATGHALSDPFLSSAQQTALPVAMYIDNGASGVAHKWPPTPSFTILSQKAKNGKIKE